MSRGRTLENAGTSNTSSNVSALPRRRMESSGRKSKLYGCRCKVPVWRRAVACAKARAATLPANSSRGVARHDPTLRRPARRLGASARVVLPAEAQWKWRDKGGHVQYSDLPPPAGTPDQDILARPSPRCTARRPRPRRLPPRRSRRAARLSQRPSRAPPMPSSRPSARRPRPTQQPRPRPIRSATRRSAPTTAARAKASCTTLESGIRLAQHQSEEGRTRDPRRQAARRRSAAHARRDLRELQIAQRRTFSRSRRARSRRASFGSIVNGR